MSASNQVANADWPVFHTEESPSSRKGQPITEEEKDIVTSLKKGNNDCWVDTQNYGGNTLFRGYCEHKHCETKVKILREDGRIELRIRPPHQRHDVSPERGLKLSARKHVEKNHYKAVDDIYEDHTPIEDVLALDPDKATRAGDKSEFRNVLVLSHDVGSADDWKEITFTMPTALKAIKDVHKLWGTGRVQLEIDFAKGFWDGIDTRQIGMVGLSDAMRVFHPLVLGIMDSEDGNNSRKLLQLAIKMVKHNLALVNRLLKDGGSALQSAAELLQLLEAACLAHLTRRPFERGGGKKGSKGSLIRYLLTNKIKRVPLEDVYDVLSCVFAMRHLVSLADWNAARRLLILKHKGLPDHVWEHYIPPYPHFGSAIHYAGENESSNGLEVTWKHLRRKKKNHCKKNAGTADVLGIVEAVSQREEQRPADYKFHTKPVIAKCHYDLIVQLSEDNPGSDVLCASYYSLKDGRLLHRKDAVGKASEIEGYRVYLPNDVFSDELKNESIRSSIGSTDAGMTVFQASQCAEMKKSKRQIEEHNLSVRRSFTEKLGQALHKNTPHLLPEEDFNSFVTRRAQRYPSEKQLLKEPLGKKSAFKEQQKADLEKRKWEKNAKDSVHDCLTESLDGCAGGKVANNSGVNDTDANDACEISDEEEADEIVRKQVDEIKRKKDAECADDKEEHQRLCGRALGQLKEVMVTSDGVSCTCEFFMMRGWCYDSLMYEIVELNHKPPSIDPIFSFESVIEGVLVPRLDPDNKMSRFGIKITVSSDKKAVIQSIGTSPADVECVEAIQERISCRRTVQHQK